MKTPHKHAEVIKAWADGALIQYRSKCNNAWRDATETPPMWYSDWEYRVKPEPKPDMVYYGQLDEPVRGAFTLGTCFTRLQDRYDQVKLTFDGSTGKLKSVEML